MQKTIASSTRLSGWLWYSLLCCLISMVFAITASGQSCPPPSPSISSSQLPTDVSIPASCTGNPIAYFDDFSWRSFTALIWPAANGQRGVPDTSQSSFPTSGPLVFETYKADWETFLPGGAAPSPWSSFAGTQNPCKNHPDVGWSDFVLASDTKFGNLGLAGFGPFLVGPVIAQNQTYVSYIASYNQTEYDQILNQQWYLQKNIQSQLTFCSNGATVNGQQCPAENSVDLKAAWMDMNYVSNPSRYYTRTAYVLDLVSGYCTLKTVGLVGFHIVQKTPSRPQWIWTTFEQVDNVPPQGSKPPYKQKFGFNDGTAKAMPASNPWCVPNTANPNGCPPKTPPPNVMPEVPPPPFNITRVQPINPSTQNTNAAYQQLFASAAPNSPWQYYELVMTQWPIKPQPTQLKPPAFPSNTFPGCPFDPNTGNCTNPNPGTSFANAVLETFDQTKVGTGCMNCHNATSVNDLLWSLAVNAYPPPQGNAAALGAAEPATLEDLHKLKDLLDSATTNNKQRLQTNQPKENKPKSKSK